MTNENDPKHEPEITVTAADSATESTPKSSLIVVSNRLPFVLKRGPNNTYVRQAR